MTKQHSTTIYGERKHGQHLGAEERGVIQALKSWVIATEPSLVRSTAALPWYAMS